MIELRRVETEADADVFLALRSEIDPEHLTPRAAYLEHLRSRRRLDLLGVLDGVAVGTGFVEPHGDDLAGEAGTNATSIGCTFAGRYSTGSRTRRSTATTTSTTYAPSRG